ncbi:MAG: DUF6316 family protein, partial [Pseudomonadota bacterium]
WEYTSKEVVVPVNRLEGRVFVKNGLMCLITEVDNDQRTARISYTDGEQRIVEQMEIAEVSALVAVSVGIQYDNLNSSRTMARISEQNDGWYFSAREGDQGPYKTEKRAQQELRRFLLNAQVLPNRQNREGNGV